MSDDEADPELLELLRESLGLNKKKGDEISSETGILKDAEYISRNAIDVSIDMLGTRQAAAAIYEAMQERSYSTKTWNQHDLHPSLDQGFDEVGMVNFIFTMDLLNFSFWSALPDDQRYQVEYRGKRWTGYNSLVASLRRALDEGIPITTPRFWADRRTLDETLESVFRSATEEPIPLLKERIDILRQAGDVLQTLFPDPFNTMDDGDNASSSVPADRLSPTDEQVPGNVAGRQSPRSARDQVSATANQPIDSSTSMNNDGAKGPADEATNGIESLDDGARIDFELGSDAEKPVTLDEVADIMPGQNGAKALETSDGTQNDESDTDAAINDAKRRTHLTNLTLHLARHRSNPDSSVVKFVELAGGSAGKLVNLLAKHFPCFRDEARFDGRRVKIMKRTQIFVADLWAALDQQGLGYFIDIDHLTMFADYRVPQILHCLGVLSYSPPLQYCIIDQKIIESGHSWEVQLRGCSIWAVELIQREILKKHPDTNVNAVLIDFFLYDLAKEREGKEGEQGLTIAHHRTRSIWY